MLDDELHFRLLIGENGASWLRLSASGSLATWPQSGKKIRESGGRCVG